MLLSILVLVIYSVLFKCTFSFCVNEAIHVKRIKCVIYIYLVLFCFVQGHIRVSAEIDGITLNGSVHALVLITQIHVQTGDCSPLNPYDELLSDGSIIGRLSPPPAAALLETVNMIST